MLVDHHCHLDFPQFADDLDGVVARACAAGVGGCVTISTRIRQFDRLRAIVDAQPTVFCSVGTHPHYAHEELDVPVEEIIRLSAHPKCVAIGEAGLDYYYQKSPREAQAEGFRRHIAAARETGLPLVIHAREADADTAAILEEEMARGPFTAVLHCFTGGRELAERGLALGLYISFSGVVTFKNGAALRDIARDVPADRILVETDAPYLAPVPHRGKPNEPAYVAHTAAVVADVRGEPMDAFARQTTENFLRLYSKVAAEVILEPPVDRNPAADGTLTGTGTGQRVVGR
ncbi:MAG: TatD family hydrolase [Pseudomonadota bacterium]